MKLKRFKSCIIIIALFALVIVQLQGCTAQQPANTEENSIKTQQVVMWKFQSNKEDYMIDNWVQEWNENNQEIKVKLEIIPYNDYLANKLPIAFATNSAPDIYMISAGSFLKYAKAGCMFPLNDYIDSDLKSDFYEQSLMAATYNGDILGIPIEREPLALFYNKNIFEENGLNPPINWDELLILVKKLHSSRMAGISLPWIANDYQNFIFYSFLMQVGGSIDIESGTSNFRENGAKAFKLWRDLSKYNYKSEATIQSPSDIYPLVSEQAAMQICGYWAVKTLEKYYADFDYGVTPVPYDKDGKNTSVYGGWYQCVNPKSENADAAAKFTIWMWGEDEKRPLQWCTEASSKFPARKSILENSNNQSFNSPVSSMFKNEILSNAVPEPRYPVEISNIVSRAIQEAMFTDILIEDIVNSAADDIDKFLNIDDSQL